MSSAYYTHWQEVDNKLKELRESVRAFQVACDIVKKEDATQTHGATAALFIDQRNLRIELTATLRKWYMLTLLKDVDKECVLIKDMENNKDYITEKLVDLAAVVGPQVLPDIVVKAKTMREECEKRTQEHAAGDGVSLRVLWVRCLLALVDAEIRYAPMWSQLEPGVATVQARIKKDEEIKEIEGILNEEDDWSEVASSK